MNAWINYHHLYYFKIIAEEESVSKAAEKLRLGQPTLSAQLKQFEETLGIQLFERQHKRLILSDQGKVALDYACSIFKLGNEMYEVLHNRHISTRIHLQIGALDSIPKQVILNLSKAAYQAGPCSVTLIEGKVDEMIRELNTHRIDLFVSNSLPTSSEIKGLKYRSITKNQVSIYGSSEFRNLKKGFPGSLSRKKFVLPTYDSKLRHDIEHWASINEVAMDIVAETQDISLKKLMAVEGLGLIPAATYSVERYIENGELFEIAELRGVFEELFLIFVDRKISHPIVKEIIKSFTI